MSPNQREALIEEAVSAYRERDAEGRLLPSPAWSDLAPADREEAFERGLAWRRLERALDPEGLSAAARAVVERAGRVRQL